MDRSERDVRGDLPAAGVPAAGAAPHVAGAAPSDRMLVQWHVTERCNLRCSHCYQDDEPAHADDGRLARVLERIERFVSHCRTRAAGRPFRAHLTLTGGEPFVHPGFLPLLERIAAAAPRYSFAVLTNGTLVDRALALRLARLAPGFVQVSLDGTPRTHDRIRGSGSHARAVEGIRQLVRAGIPTLISFTAQRSNFREFPHVARLGRDLGVARVWSDRLIPQGRGAADDCLTPDETREWVRLMREARRRSRGPGAAVSLHRALQFSDDGDCRYRCTAGDTLLAVLPNGDVLPCRRMPIVVGNLLERPLVEIHASHPTLRALRDRTVASRGCERCFYSETCGGGLRCLAYAVHGDPFRADPGCWLADDRAVAPAAARPPDGFVPLEAVTRSS